MPKQKKSFWATLSEEATSDSISTISQECWTETDPIFFLHKVRIGFKAEAKILRFKLEGQGPLWFWHESCGEWSQSYKHSVSKAIVETKNEDVSEKSVSVS
jgi:hypothetical protein